MSDVSNINMFLKKRDWVGKYDWRFLSMNITDLNKMESKMYSYTYDYELIKKTKLVVNEEIHQHVYHPRYIQKYIDEYGIEALDEYMA